MAVAILGRIVIVLLALVTVLGVVGLIMIRHAKRKGDVVGTEDPAENVVDLNDRFNRARYMQEDGN